MTCETCRFWEDGQCKRHAPTRDGRDIVRLWPETTATDSCGDYECRATVEFVRQLREHAAVQSAAYIQRQRQEFLGGHSR